MNRPTPASRPGSRSGRQTSPARFGAVFLLILFAAAAPARSLRVATFNVEHGIGEAGTEKGEAQRAVLRRVNADIIAFQELNARTSNEWVRLSSELGYPYRAWGGMGPFAGGMAVGFFSRHPIRESSPVVSPDGAREFSRLPLRITVDVEGAAGPITLWNLHHKAMFRPVDEFRRAVEALRVARDIERVVAEEPDRAGWIVIGDMNDDPARCEDPARAPQSAAFAAPPEGLPRSFVLGPDIPFPLPYRVFPLHAYRDAGPGFHPVDATREGSDSRVTHLYTNYRLDYILVCDAFRSPDGGRPLGEVYHSDWEAGGGLPKSGERPPPGSSGSASDHYIVFADLWIPAAGSDGNE